MWLTYALIQKMTDAQPSITNRAHVYFPAEVCVNFALLRRTERVES